MDYYQEINTAKNLFLTTIYEPEENCLEFELVIGKVSEELKDIVLNEKKTIPAHQIYHDDECPTYKVTFDGYIGYSVLNESYENLGKEFMGGWIKVCTDSNFLNYIKQDTFATLDYPGEFKHYCFMSLRHIVNVASTKEPIIEKVN